MYNVGDKVRLERNYLTKRLKKKPGSAYGRSVGRVVSLESPYGPDWIEVKWSGKVLAHRFSNIHQLERVK